MVVRDGRGSQPVPNQPMQMMPNMPSRPQNMPVGPTGYPVMDAKMRDQMASGATVFPSDLGSGPHDSNRAADMASPVGHQYPGQVDWGTAAGMPVRAMPPWMLAVLFVGALGGALLITILIAQAVR